MNDAFERRQKLQLINSEKGLKILKGLTIAGLIATAAATGLGILGLVPTELAVAIGSHTAIAGTTWLLGEVDMDSMLEAASSQSIGDLAADIKRSRGR